MVQTRRGGETSGDAPGGSNAGGAQQPPPAPPMTPMEQLIHNQNEMFRMFMENMNRQGGQAPLPPQPQAPRESSYGDFWATHPPQFGEASDPLEADNFIHIIESKFALLNCTTHQKTLFAAQQLRGSASAWWASFTAAPPADHQVTWPEFCAAFVRITFQPVS